MCVWVCVLADVSLRGGVCVGLRGDVLTRVCVCAGVCVLVWVVCMGVCGGVFVGMCVHVGVFMRMFVCKGACTRVCLRGVFVCVRTLVYGRGSVFLGRGVVFVRVCARRVCVCTPCSCGGVFLWVCARVFVNLQCEDQISPQRIFDLVGTSIPQFTYKSRSMLFISDVKLWFV